MLATIMLIIAITARTGKITAAAKVPLVMTVDPGSDVNKVAEY